MITGRTASFEGGPESVMILLSLLAAASLNAAMPTVTEVSVTFDAELLSTSAGREKVYDRLNRSAKRACVDQPMHATTIRAAEGCMADLMDDLVAQVGDARLTALHNGEARPAYARR